jgi:hypothetical protein
MPRSILAQLVVALRDQASAPAKTVADALRGVTGAANDLSKAKVGDSLKRGMDDARRSAKELAQAMSSANWGDKFTGQLGKLRVSAGEMRNLRREWAELQRELANPIGGRTAFGVLGVEGKWKKQKLNEIVAVRAEMARLREEWNQPMGVLRRGGRFAAGAVGVYGGAHLINRAGRSAALAAGIGEREGARDYLGGLTEKESTKLKSASFSTSERFKSIDAATLHNLLRETALSTGEIGKALELASPLAQAMTTLQSLKGRESALSQLTGFVRALDTLGKNTDPAQMRSLIDGATKAAGVMGAEYSPADVWTTAKTAKSAGFSLSDEFINQVLPALIADMGPSRPGTALGSGTAQLIGGRATKEAKAYQAELGLRKDGKFLTRDLFAANPYQWANEVLVPALQKAGVDTKNNSAVTEAANKLFSNQTVADVMGRMVTQREQIDKTIVALGKAPGLAAAEVLPGKDPFVAAASAMAQLRNAAAALAEPAVPMATNALNSFASAMAGFTNRLRNDPSLASQAAATATGAATGGGLGGGIMALRALWQGRGTGGALAGLLKGGAIGGLGGGILGYGASKVGEWLSSAAGSVGKVAAGSNWKAQSPEGQADLENQLQGVQERIAGIKARAHPSRANESNPEVDRLELEATDLRNRIAAGRPSAPKPDYQQAARAVAESQGQPRFKIAGLPDRPQGGAASNSLYSGVGLADQTPDPRLTKTAQPSSMFGASPTAPPPMVDAASAATNGQAAGFALGSGVAAGIAAQAPAVEAQGRSLMERIKAMFSGGVNVPVNLQPSGGGASGASATPMAPARASGGSVMAGGLYQINEYDQEFFQPSENGKVIDPRRMKGGGGAGGGGPVSVSISPTINVSGASDPSAVVDQVVAAINDRVQEAARSAFADMGVELA